MKILRAGQIVKGGLLAALVGGLVGAITGGLSFGVMHAAMLWGLRGGGGSPLFQPYNIRLGFQIGAGLGLAVGVLSWFVPGLLRTARRLPFPWWRLCKTVMAGALVGNAVMALNSGLYLVYLARTGGAGNRTTMQFLQTGLLPGNIGPFPTVEFPMFAMFIGLILGVAGGTWWGLRPPKTLQSNDSNGNHLSDSPNAVRNELTDEKVVLVV